MSVYVNREKSWLKFNERVMQEAQDETVPLVERIRFVGIFSSNLDEFFKVRYAYVRRVMVAKMSGKKEIGISATQLLNEIEVEIEKQQHIAQNLLDELMLELEREGVLIINENQVNQEQSEFLIDYYNDNIAQTIMIVMLDQIDSLPNLKDEAIYLGVEMMKKSKDNIKEKTNYAIIEIPAKGKKRFIEIPSKDKDLRYIILMDDVIRFNLGYIFRFFDYDTFNANVIKVTRDAELDIDNDISRSFVDKISRSLKKRKNSRAIRLTYDEDISEGYLNFLKLKIGIDKYDNLTSGGKYHNKRDYTSFPSLGKEELVYSKIRPLPVKDFNLYESIIEQIKKRDYLMHTPYHNYSYLISFLKEAALDPKVKSVKITLYRVSDNSRVVKALINAARNGKLVIVQIELRARFDEEANINWAEKMRSEGIKLIFGVKGLKVHSKICLIERKETTGLLKYGFVSTGNFNEDTANVYTDYTLFTAHQGILSDMDKIFDFFDTNYIINKYRHLIVSPHHTRKDFVKLIDDEISVAERGGNAYINMRMNSLVDKAMIEQLYEASIAGVTIKLVVRGICSLIPGLENISENIEVISVVDKFLEHPRVYIFGNNGDEKIFISSADLMTRNLDHRVEVTCPIYDKDIKKEIIDTFSIIWSDNVKARIINYEQDNVYRDLPGDRVRAHFDTYNYYKKLLK
ncbi:MAG: polyphosphate kinase 1 [Ichthyobacteriaceae bacterium]|nr:polyphosphate kinase 1 [Ichthyobacteriaceae bacterium]